MASIWLRAAVRWWRGLATCKEERLKSRMRYKAGEGAERRYRHACGHFVWVQVTTSIVRSEDQSPLYSVVQVQDISHRKERDRRLEYFVDHDFLTGLFNRRLAPGAFLHNAERVGMIRAIDGWVVQKTITRGDIDAHQLIFEITETVAISDCEGTKQFAVGLRSEDAGSPWMVVERAWAHASISRISPSTRMKPRWRSCASSGSATRRAISSVPRAPVGSVAARQRPPQVNIAGGDCS